MARRKQSKPRRKTPPRKRAAKPRKSGGRYQLIGPDGHAIKVPAKMQRALATVASAIEEGETVTVLKHEQHLTTQQAADILNVSRQYVVRLIDEGKLPATSTGTHRRLLESDVLDYKDNRDKRRRQALAKIARLGQEQKVGGYYDDWTPAKSTE